MCMFDWKNTLSLRETILYINRHSSLIKFEEKFVKERQKLKQIKLTSIFRELHKNWFHWKFKFKYHRKKNLYIF